MTGHVEGLMKDDVILVLGMHRSGTSLMARAMSTLGVGLGRADASDANLANAKGYYEHPVAVSANDTLLHLLGGVWHRPLNLRGGAFDSPSVGILAEQTAERLRCDLGAGVPLAIKDPRTMRVLPFWMRVVEKLERRVKLVLAVRHPMEVAASLLQRDGIPAVEGLRLWLEHHARCFSDSGGHPSLVCLYPSLLEAPRREIERMSAWLGLGVREDATRDFVEGFIDSSLYRQKAMPFSLRERGIEHSAVRGFRLLEELSKSIPGALGSEVADFWGEIAKAIDNNHRYWRSATDDRVSLLLANPAQAPSWQDSALQARRVAHVDSTPGETAFCIHIHYPETWPVISDRLVGLRASFGVFVSLTPEAAFLEDRIRADFPSVQIFHVPNRGRDLAPFLIKARAARDSGYRYVCKLHGKKSVHLAGGGTWRDELIHSLLDDDDAVARIEEYFRTHPGVGLIGPSGHELPQRPFIGANQEAVSRLAELLGFQFDIEAGRFFAGSMFWARLDALRPLLDAEIESDDFEVECGQIDGTLAHAIERVIGCVVEQAGHRAVPTNAETNPRAFLSALRQESPQLYVGQLAGERDQAIEARSRAESLAVERLEAVRGQEQRIAHAEASLVAAEQIVAKLRAETVFMDERLKAADAALASSEGLVARQQAELTLLDERLKAADAALAASEGLVARQQAELTLLDERLKAADAALASSEGLVARQQAELTLLDERLKSADIGLADASALILARDRSIVGLSEGLAIAESLATQRMEVARKLETELHLVSDGLAKAESLAIQRLNALSQLDAELAGARESLALSQSLAIERLDTLRAKDELIAATQSKLSAVEFLVLERNERISKLESDLEAIRASWAWRMTAPLRSMARRLGMRAP